MTRNQFDGTNNSMLYLAADSPWSRVVKLCFINANISHATNVLTWKDLKLPVANRGALNQVPTFRFKGEIYTDSFLILAKIFISKKWIWSADALLFKAIQDQWGKILHLMYFLKQAQDSRHSRLVLEQLRESFLAIEPQLRIVLAEKSTSIEIAPGQALLQIMICYLNYFEKNTVHQMPQIFFEVIKKVENSYGFDVYSEYLMLNGSILPILVDVSKN